jgi:uncharacterized protein (DUF169 family)
MNAQNKMTEFLARPGLNEEPMGVFYTNQEPSQGFTPEPMDLPNRDKEAQGQVDWRRVFSEFSCVVGGIWRARRKKTAAYFDASRFGCMGGAFFLGFVKPQTETIIHYVSTGVPGQMEGEWYVDSPETLRSIFDRLDPRPATARWCVFKPLSLFKERESPELVVFFARPEIMAGLHQLAAFVTSNPEVVASPWGAACANMVAWPFHFLERGQERAVLGGWDPSARKFFKTDELTLTVPLSLYQAMLSRWRESFLGKEVWDLCRKKINRSAKVWGEAEVS